MPDFVIPPGQEARFLEMAGAVSATSGCELRASSISIDHVDATYACPAGEIHATFVHPSQAPAGALVAGDFAVSFEPSPPESLRATLSQSLSAAAGTWPWKQSSETPKNEPPRVDSKGIPLDPSWGSTELVPRKDLAAQLLPAAEIVVAILCLLGLVVALRRLRVARAVWRNAALGLTAAASLRIAVPWVPANYYTDLDVGVSNFRYDPTYHPPLHALLQLLHVRASALMLVNVALGSLAVALLYLALNDEAMRSDAPRSNVAQQLATPSWNSALFALLVAVTPIFVRIAASDAPHVVGLFWLTVAAIVLGPALRSKSIAWCLLLGATCWLVGAARRELALAPLLLVAFAWVANVSRECKRRVTVALVVGSFLGAMVTPVAILGHPNVEIALRKEWVIAYVRALPHAMSAAFGGAPWILPIGLAVVATCSLLSKRVAPILVYCALFVAETWIYALTPFGAAIDHPLQSWALARYASLWLLLPTYFAAAGIGHAWRWAAEKWKPATYVGALPVCALALSSSPSLTRLHGYQHEYRFLRRELNGAHNDLPLVVIWQKGKGIDYCESLAAPHYGYTELAPARDVYVLPTSIALEGYFDRLPPRFVYFRSVLSEVDTNALAAFPPETRSSLEEAHRTDCVLRHGELLRAWRGLPLEYIQLPVPGETADLELWLVDREAVRSELARCSNVEKVK